MAWVPVLLLVSCATTTTEGATLPFHVAIAPIDVGLLQATTPIENGDPAGIELAFDETSTANSLLEAMRQRFTRATLLSPPRDGATLQDNYQSWFDEARAKGADLLLYAVLRYDRAIHTALNDSFWLNFPLFAFGGPFNWFVNDRSYFVDVRLDAQVYCVEKVGEQIPPARVTRAMPLSARTQEVTLDFIDRGDGPLAYALTLIVPSGFVSSASDAVPGELAGTIENALSVDLALNAVAGALQLERWDAVDFHPGNLRVSEDGGHLEGDVVLKLDGAASRLRFLRYRTDAGQYQEYKLGPGRRYPKSGVEPENRRYSIRIPLPKDARWIQVNIGQEDDDVTSRTFTFPVRRS